MLRTRVFASAVWMARAVPGIRTPQQRIVHGLQPFAQAFIPVLACRYKKIPSAGMRARKQFQFFQKEDELKQQAMQVDLPPKNEEIIRRILEVQREHDPEGFDDATIELPDSISARFIGQDGNSIGSFTVRECIDKAEAMNLDAVLMHVDERKWPPKAIVIKSLNFAEFKKEAVAHARKLVEDSIDDKASAARDKKVKEVNFTTKIDHAGLQRKLGQILKFLKKGHAVRITMKRWLEDPRDPTAGDAEYRKFAKGIDKALVDVGAIVSADIRTRSAVFNVLPSNNLDEATEKIKI
eukprot:Clim_evm19s44 gene=Clim_evmTU19s44